MNQIFYDAVGNNPIIAAVKNMKDIEVSCTIEEIQVIFILFGDVCSIDRIVKRVKDAGKVAMVHVDLISGLSPKEVSVEYLKEHTEADGIISTKPKNLGCIRSSDIFCWIPWHLRISDSNSI